MKTTLYWIGAVSVCWLTWLVSYYAFFEPPYLSYKELPFSVIADVHAGEVVLMRLHRCNADSVTRLYLVSHSLINMQTGEKIILEATHSSLEPGCHELISAANTVPKGTPPGRYVIDGYAEVQGTIRTTSVHWMSQPFQVL